jgi:hypothetical protein
MALRQARNYRSNRRNALRKGKQGGIGPNTLRRPQASAGSYWYWNTRERGTYTNLALGVYFK